MMSFQRKHINLYVYCVSWYLVALLVVVIYSRVILVVVILFENNNISHFMSRDKNKSLKKGKQKNIER